MAKKTEKVKMWLGRISSTGDYNIMGKQAGTFDWNRRWGFEVPGSFKKDDGYGDSMDGSIEICVEHFHKLFPIRMKPGQKPILVEVSIKRVKLPKKKGRK